MNELKVSISNGNIKMGAIPSVSLPACITCNPAAPCFKECYAVRMARRYKNTNAAYKRNLSILQKDSSLYWMQVKTAAMFTTYFRFHVSGDIPNIEYFHNMIRLARELPGTKFLAFTKQYKIVNEYLNNGGAIPENLKIIFSNWDNWKTENPYNLPVCEVIFPHTAVNEKWKICGGNCTECACRGIGCWELQQGETIAIKKH